MDGLIDVNDMDARSCLLLELLQWGLYRDPDLSATAQLRINAGIKRFYRQPQLLPNVEAVVKFVSYPGVCDKNGRALDAETAREANAWLERWLERQVRTREAARATK